MSFEIVVQRMLEYRRLVTEAEIADTGVYVKGEVPDDSTSVATIEICYAVVATDVNGRIQFTIFNPPELMNKSRAKGLPIKVEGRIIRPGTGTPYISATWKPNLFLNAVVKEMADATWVIFQKEMENNPTVGNWMV